MSQGQSIPRAHALAMARHVIVLLESGCERIEIAGSLRRGKAEVHDMEIVAVPRWAERSTGDLWGSVETFDALDQSLAIALAAGAVASRVVEVHRADGSVERSQRMGPAYKALEAGGVPLDLFIVRPPASWGVIFGLRTGPGDWNTRLVAECKTIGRRVAGGQVERWDGATWQAVETPEEADFFREIGQSWIEPADRHVSKVRIQRQLVSA